MKTFVALALLLFVPGAAQAAILVASLLVLACGTPVAAASAVEPDTVRAWTADGAMEFPHWPDPRLSASGALVLPRVGPSPGSALSVGLASTVAPVVLSTALAAGSPGAESIASFGFGMGLLIGPAAGLWYGGRGDLAGTGLVIRGVGMGLAIAGLVAVGNAISEERSTSATAPLALLGLMGTIATLVSAGHDLAITPSAVEQARLGRR